MLLVTNCLLTKILPSFVFSPLQINIAETLALKKTPWNFRTSEQFYAVTASAHMVYKKDYSNKYFSPAPQTSMHQQNSITRKDVVISAK